MLFDAWENKYADNREDGKYQEIPFIILSEIRLSSITPDGVLLCVRPFRYRVAGKSVPIKSPFGRAGGRRSGIGEPRCFHRSNSNCPLKSRARQNGRW